MKQLLINDEWITPPSEDLDNWLRECIAVELNFNTLMVQRYISRYQLVRAMRKSPRHKAEIIRIIL